MKLSICAPNPDAALEAEHLAERVAALRIRLQERGGAASSWVSNAEEYLRLVAADLHEAPL